METGHRSDAVLMMLLTADDHRRLPALMFSVLIRLLSADAQHCRWIHSP